MSAACSAPTRPPRLTGPVFGRPVGSLIMIKIACRRPAAERRRSVHARRLARGSRTRPTVSDLRATLTLVMYALIVPRPVAATRRANSVYRYTQTVHGSRRSSQVGLTSPARRPSPTPVLHAGWTSGRDRIEGARQTAPGRASRAAGSSWRANPNGPATDSCNHTFIHRAHVVVDDREER